MAVTKILPRSARLDQAIEYVLNGDKTENRILTAHLNCDPGREYQQMMDKGYEIHHGNRLGFRLRGQERFQYPGRKDTRFTEDGIQNAIHGVMEEIEAGRWPAVTHRTPYRPYRKHPKYTGFLALYVHYLYVLGKIQKQQYPPRMTPHLKQEVMKFERYREKFQFLRENNIATPNDMAAFQARTEETLTQLTKQRTVLNVRKKQRAPLYAALADVEALAMAKQFYDEGHSGVEQQFEQYMEAVKQPTKWYG